MESFLFLHFKLSSAIKDYLHRKEKTIIYYNTLEFEARTMIVHKNFIKVTTKDSLQLLREVLGHGIGLGLAKERLSEKDPWCVCTINNILTSLEVSNNNAMAEDINHAVGVFLMYTEEKWLLTCSVQFSKLPVHRVEDVTSRLPHARVDEADTAAYVGVWF
jgi:hypothetical protein